MRPTRLLIIDAHPIFLDGLSAAIEGAWPATQVVRAEALEPTPTHGAAAPDVIIADSDLFDSAESLRPFVQAVSPAVVLVMTGRPDASSAAAAIDAGARGYLPKTMSAEAVKGAISLALSGGVCFPSIALQEVSAPSPQPRLSRGRRELEILRLLDEGNSNKAIARELGLSVATIKLHVQSILRSTGARNRVEATINARRMGMLPPRAR